MSAASPPCLVHRVWVMSGICTTRYRTALTMLCRPLAKFRSIRGKVTMSKSGVTGSQTPRTTLTKCPTTSRTSAMGVTRSSVRSTRLKQSSPLEAGHGTATVCTHPKRERDRCLEKPYTDTPIRPKVTDSEMSVGRK